MKQPAQMPLAWDLRLEAVEKDRAEQKAARKWLIGFALTALVTIMGSVIAGAVAYGEMRGTINALRDDVGEIRQDVRALRGEH